MNWENLSLDTVQKDKNRLRNELSASVTNLRQAGKVAQQLRSCPSYRRAERIFVSPAKDLKQIRINCLVDGKELIMPGPALKDGLYGFQPYFVNFTDLEYAVTFNGLKKYGKLLDLSKTLPVDLFLTDGFALSCEGSRLGDGNGFFDLAFAVLAWSYPGNADSKVGMVCNEEQVISMPISTAPWDVDADFYISSEGQRDLIPAKGRSRSEREAGPIFWQHLSYQRIKKVSPLWKIWKNRS
ncbi:MAG: 5-formyltetrahydrofolate cyclo-ligase [Thermodesulfobacteriota bacterium]